MYRFELENEAAAAAARPRDQRLPAAHGSRARRRAARSRRPHLSARQAVPAGLSQGGQEKAKRRDRRRSCPRQRRQTGRGAGSRAPAPARCMRRRLTPCGCSRSARRSRRRPVARRARATRRNGHAPDARRATSVAYGGEGWLTAVNVQKSYRSRIGGEGRQPRHAAAARRSACSVPTAPARPPCST